MRTTDGIKKLPINFDTDFKIQSLNDNFKMEKELDSKYKEQSDTTESEGNASKENLEVFMMISNELEIIEGTPEITSIHMSGKSERQNSEEILKEL